MSFLKKLQQALQPSGNQLVSALKAGFKKGNKNWQDIARHLVDALIMADIPPQLAQNIVDKLPSNIESSEEATAKIINIITTMISPFEKKIDDLFSLGLDAKPAVLLMVGVNGTGKTTTLAKLTALAQAAGLKTLLVAGDSFRAAGSSQLISWAKKLQVDYWDGEKQNSTDPAAIAHGGYNHAVAQGHQLVLIDTAGRLHTNSNLMAELEKIVRVLKKIDPNLPHSCLITLDATTGQNASTQVEMFQKVAPLTGMVITKMDGLAKGGMVLSILQKHGLPLYALGVGEKPEDIDQFDAAQFAKSLFAQ